MSLVLSIAVAVATVMGAGMIVPQVVRLHRTRAVAGVSGTWVGLGLAMNAWWIAYATSQELWGLVPVSAGSIVLYLVVALQYTRLTAGAGALSVLVGMVGAASVPALALALGGWGAAGLSIGMAYAIQFSPAVITALRSIDLSGISPTTWAMAWIEAVIWCSYGSVQADAALLVGGGGGALMATVILVRLWSSARPALRIAS
ncbi:MAG: hypothetical protein ACSLFP_02015 [Acidimicrobiales bacterium]